MGSLFIHYSLLSLAASSSYSIRLNQNVSVTLTQYWLSKSTMTGLGHILFLPQTQICECLSTLLPKLYITGDKAPTTSLTRHGQDFYALVIIQEYKIGSGTKALLYSPLSIVHFVRGAVSFNLVQKAQMLIKLSNTKTDMD